MFNLLFLLSFTSFKTCLSFYSIIFSNIAMTFLAKQDRKSNYHLLVQWAPFRGQNALHRIYPILSFNYFTFFWYIEIYALYSSGTNHLETWLNVHEFGLNSNNHNLAKTWSEDKVRPVLELSTFKWAYIRYHLGNVLQVPNIQVSKLHVHCAVNR